MNDNERDEQELAPDEQVVDAEELVIEETSVDDEPYDEVIVLDLRQPDTHDLWLC